MQNNVQCLFESPHLEHAYLFLCEETPIAALHILLGKTGKVDAIELHHTITQTFENAAHNTILTTMNFDTYLFLICRTGVINSICFDFTIFEHNTFCYLAYVGSRNVLVGMNVVNLLLQELGMCELRSHFTIVGKQQHTCCIAVKASNRIDTFRASIAHEIHHGLTILRILTGRNISLRLVKQNVHLLLNLHCVVVEKHHIRTQNLCAQFRNHLSVDRNHTSFDVFIGITT